MPQHSAADPHAGDRTAITETAKKLEDAWNVHDVHAFAMAFTADADFTNVVGMHAAGRANIESFHAPFFATIFKDSNMMLSIRSIRFLTHDLAAVDIESEMTGAKAPDGTPRPYRKSLINCIMAKQGDASWLILVLHNTELPVTPLAAGKP